MLSRHSLIRTDEDLSSVGAADGRVKSLLTKAASTDVAPAKPPRRKMSRQESMHELEEIACRLAPGVEGRIVVLGVQVRVVALGVQVRVVALGVQVTVVALSVQVRVVALGVQVRVVTLGVQVRVVTLGV